MVAMAKHPTNILKAGEETITVDTISTLKLFYVFIHNNNIVQQCAVFSHLQK